MFDVAECGERAVAGRRDVYRHGSAAEGDTIVVQLGLVAVPAEVEARLAVDLEPHLPPNDSNHADEAMSVGDRLTGDRHEVDHFADAVGAEEPGDENGGPW